MEILFISASFKILIYIFFVSLSTLETIFLYKCYCFQHKGIVIVCHCEPSEFRTISCVLRSFWLRPPLSE